MAREAYQEGVEISRSRCSCDTCTADRARARDAAEAAILAADTGSEADMPAYERACKAFDEADDVLALIGRKLFEIEEDCAYEAQRRERADYWRAVL